LPYPKDTECTSGQAFSVPLAVDTAKRFPRIRLRAMAKDLVTAGADMLCLADTTGMATPLTVPPASLLRKTRSRQSSDRPTPSRYPRTRAGECYGGHVLRDFPFSILPLPAWRMSLYSRRRREHRQRKIPSICCLLCISKTGLNLSKNRPLVPETWEFFFGKHFPGKLYRHCA